MSAVHSIRPRASGRSGPGRAADPAQGERRYVRDVHVTKARECGPVHLVYHWAEGEDEPWRLVTNLPPSYAIVRCYQRRMWIEELFGDGQEGEFHLHQTRLYPPDRATRSALAVGLGGSLVYVWLVAVTSSVIKRGWRRIVDRTDRRDRSYLALGLRWIRRWLRNREPPRMRLLPCF